MFPAIKISTQHSYMIFKKLCFLFNILLFSFDWDDEKKLLTFLPFYECLM